MTLAAANVTKSGYAHTYSDGTKKVHTGTKMLFGQNIGLWKRNQRTFPFANLLKGGDLHSNTTGNSPDSNGYIDATSGGQWAIFSHSSNFNRFGTYVLTWSGTGKCTWDGGTLTYDGPNEPTPENRREYNCTATGTYVVNCTNGNFTDIKLFHEDDEARIDAGQLLSNTFITDMAGLSVVRMMDWQQMNEHRYNTDSDWLPYTYVFWDYNVPAQALAETANELDCDLWVCIPHQFTDAAVSSFCEDINTHLDAGRLCYVEYTNEAWNFANAFNDQHKWVLYWDAPTKTGTVNPADPATCTSTSHGLTTGDAIRCFSNKTHEVWPYAQGGQRFAIVDDANTFRFASTEANALADIDVGAIDSSITELIFKREDSSSQTHTQNYCQRSAEVWALAKTELGDKFVSVIAGQHDWTELVVNYLAQPNIKENLDYFATSAYLNMDDYVTDWLNKDNETITDEMLDALQGVTSSYYTDRLVEFINEDINRGGMMIIYEGGEHNVISGATQEELDKVHDWARSAAATRYYDQSLKWHATLGIHLYMHYNSHSVMGVLGSWGSREYPRHDTAAKYLGVEPFQTGGAGVPKL